MMNVKGLILTGMIMMLFLVGCSPASSPEPEETAVPPGENTSQPPPTAVPADTAVPLPTNLPEPTATPEATTPPEATAVESVYSDAANADVIFVKATETAANTWTFNVTVEHPDTGWEDYADGWDVVLPDGTILKPDPGSPFTRLLLHPHVDEQPFTRSQSRIEIPADVREVTVRAHDLLDGFGGQEVVVDLTAVSGENFEVQQLNP
jgi:hypothetical protein